MKKSFDSCRDSIGTLAGLIDAARGANAQVLARESAVIFGSAWVQATVLQLDPQTRITWPARDGASLEISCDITL